jgi:hypothetical protein
MFATILTSRGDRHDWKIFVRFDLGTGIAVLGEANQE